MTIFTDREIEIIKNAFAEVFGYENWAHDGCNAIEYGEAAHTVLVCEVPRFRRNLAFCKWDKLSEGPTVLAHLSEHLRLPLLRDEVPSYADLEGLVLAGKLEGMGFDEPYPESLLSEAS